MREVAKEPHVGYLVGEKGEKRGKQSEPSAFVSRFRLVCHIFLP